MKETENENDDKFVIIEKKSDDNFEIPKEDNEEKEDYFDILQEKKEDLKQVKIILIGESGVGKTCIIYRYVYEKFDEGTLSTIATSFEEKIVTLSDENKTEIKMEIWDTCGQEKYRNIANVFYKNSKAALLVYDSTSVESFEKIKEFWYNDIKEKADEDIGKFYFYLLL